MLHAKLFMFCALLPFFASAQEQLPQKKEMPPYNRKEEIIHYGKRYRIHNTYVTVGGGVGASDIRTNSQKTVGGDFNFFIRRHYFQAGVMMSGEEFLSNNHAQGHLGYGLRKESGRSNLAIYAGPCYYIGVQGVPPAPATDYQGYGGYISAQAVTKFAYDIGLGLELFGEFSAKQTLAGFRIIVFFSGAYRGVKKNYNPNVRSENPG